MALHIRKNDTVMVISGSEKGKQGKVIKVAPATADKPARVWVEKLRLVKKHTKAGQGTRTGGIVEKEAPIALSNVLPICPKEDRPRRVRTKLVDGERKRVCVKCGEAFAS